VIFFILRELPFGVTEMIFCRKLFVVLASQIPVCVNSDYEALALVADFSAASRTMRIHSLCILVHKLCERVVYLVEIRIELAFVWVQRRGCEFLFC